MKIVTAAEMREIDRATSEKFGIPSTTLMENAGMAVADFCAAQYPKAERITIICGRGNNGGDGFVVGRRLHEAGKKVSILLLGEPDDLRGDAKIMFEKLTIPVLYAKTPKELETKTVRSLYFDADLLVDAILGTGFSPPLTSLAECAIQMFNEARAPVVSIDLPSGVQADSTDFDQPQICRSSAIVTFTAPKPAHVLSLLTHGPIAVAPIGSPPQAIESRSGLEWCGSCMAIFKKRSVNAHKGDFGHVLIIAGSVGKSGAAAMASMGALRAGAGLVTTAVPKSILPIVASFTPELMTEPLDETDSGSISKRVLEGAGFGALLERKTVAAVGPGLSQNPETQEFIRDFVARCELPIILDADGLNAFAGKTELLDGSKRPLILTPHPGEMARLTGLPTERVTSNRLSIARNFAIQHRLILVLKGWRTIVAAPDGKIYINTTGNPGMAKGGTGDVLTGIVAGVLAQFPSRTAEAVCAAVHLHGLSGDIAVTHKEEPALLATDLLAHISEGFRESLRRSGSVVWLQGRPRQR
jgi:ADP-dependent NAD(P)H-hydrate dehydratase / NAD(P)H-hydrate epimerase